MALRGVPVAAILLALPRPTPKGATSSVACRGLRLTPAAWGQETRRWAGSGLRGAAAIRSRRWGWGSSSLLLPGSGPVSGRLRRGLWGSARRSLSLSRGPPSSPADQRPEGLEGPGLEGRDPLLTALSAGTPNYFLHQLSDSTVKGCLRDWQMVD